MNKIKKLAVAFFLQITIMVFASVSVCAQTNVPKDIPLPLQAEGWEGVTVSRLCLKVEQSYPQIEDEFSQPIAETVQRVLEPIGVHVVENGEPCDATLRFTVTLEARSDDYRGVGHLYTGANAKGRLELTGEGRPAFSVSVSRNFAPPFLVYYQPKTLQDAPFRIAWTPALIDGLFELWGVQVYINALKDEDRRVRNAAEQALSEMHDPRAVEPLITALRDQEPRIRRIAAQALRQIGDPRAVEPLSAALKDEDPSVRQNAAGALERITKQNFGQRYSRWERWWKRNKDKILKGR